MLRILRLAALTLGLLFAGCSDGETAVDSVVPSSGVLPTTVSSLATTTTVPALTTTVPVEPISTTSATSTVVTTTPATTIAPVTTIARPNPRMLAFEVDGPCYLTSSGYVCPVTVTVQVGVGNQFWFGWYEQSAINSIPSSSPRRFEGSELPLNTGTNCYGFGISNERLGNPAPRKVTTSSFETWLPSPTCTYGVPLCLALWELQSDGVFLSSNAACATNPALIPGRASCCEPPK